MIIDVNFLMDDRDAQGVRQMYKQAADETQWENEVVDTCVKAFDGELERSLNEAFQAGIRYQERQKC